MIEYSIHTIQKLMTVRCLFVVFEIQKVATRSGSPMCPPARWSAKNTEVRLFKSGGGGSETTPRYRLANRLCLRYSLVTMSCAPFKVITQAGGQYYYYPVVLVAVPRQP